jgi:hypothetical protein
MLKTYALDKDPVIVLARDALQTPAALHSKIEDIWASHGQGRFNGSMFAVDEVSPAKISGTKTEYKNFLAQKSEPSLFEQLQIRVLAVSGIVECADGFILGQRSADVTQFAGYLEFAPSGGLDVKEGSVDPVAQIYAELKEELGVESPATHHEIFVLIENTETHVLDLGIYLDFRYLGFSEIQRKHAQTGLEYTALVCHKEDALERLFEEHEIVPESLALWRMFLEKRT